MAALGPPVSLVVAAPDGDTFARVVSAPPSWLSRLPADGDYTLNVAGAAGLSHTLWLAIDSPQTELLTFETGATSTEIDGSLGPFVMRVLRIRAEAGQTYR